MVLGRKTYSILSMLRSILDSSNCNPSSKVADFPNLVSCKFNLLLTHTHTHPHTHPHTLVLCFPLSTAKYQRKLEQPEPNLIAVESRNRQLFLINLVCTKSRNCDLSIFHELRHIVISKIQCLQVEAIMTSRCTKKIVFKRNLTCLFYESLSK